MENRRLKCVDKERDNVEKIKHFAQQIFIFLNILAFLVNAPNSTVNIIAKWQTLRNENVSSKFN